mmetsp:Transcript_18064/g.53502  ORF Transcript_18064/g.53502 Transcript_18064/m.53502 type:complete len:365 (+) Transcript_18064:3-1097(+)
MMRMSLGSMAAVISVTAMLVTAVGGWATLPGNTTISGISSGADFAVQFHVAFSASLSGVGVFAGQPFQCAVTRFPRDELQNHTNPSVPVCAGCPAGTSLVYDHCKNHPQVVDVALLANSATSLAAAGKIDNTSNLHNHRVFLYRGTKDPCYVAGSLAQTLLFYSLFVERVNGNIAFEDAVPSLHAFPTDNGFGSTCGTDDHHNDSYIEACDYSGAKGVLQQMYGPLKPPASVATGTLSAIDQTKYFGRDGSGGMADTAYVYVPKQCSDATAPRCRLHVFHHGCGGPGPNGFFINAVHHAGFNELADTNNVVVLYPAMSSWGTTTQTKAGCWDAYGQTGADYATQDGIQMGNVKRMIDAVSAGKI